MEEKIEQLSKQVEELTKQVESLKQSIQPITTYQPVTVPYIVPMPCTIPSTYPGRVTITCETSGFRQNP